MVFKIIKSFGIVKVFPLPYCFTIMLFSSSPPEDIEYKIGERKQEYLLKWWESQAEHGK